MGGWKWPENLMCDVLRRATNENERGGCSRGSNYFPMTVANHHDTADPETGFIQYELVFGRHCPGVGVPYFIGRECVEAAELCARADVFEGGVAKAAAPSSRIEQQKPRSCVPSFHSG